MIHSYSLHKINNSLNFSFKPSDYSRFKYGDNSISEKFGIELANSFVRDVLSKQTNTCQFVVIPSPYSFIPTATNSLKNYFVFALNNWLVQNNYPIIQETKIHRTITYKEDYGELNAESRIKLIENDQFHIDKSFLTDKTLIFLDDIRITGSHEKMITRMLDLFDIKNPSYLLYFAELINKDIHPNIENYLNYFDINSIFDLDDIIKNDFAINTRVVKYILKSESKDFRVFIQNKSNKFLNLLYNMALGNGYYDIEDYRANLLILQKELNLISQQKIEENKFININI